MAFKQLAQWTRRFRKTISSASGDANSAANLAQMGMTFRQISFNNGDSGKYVINQLVGIAIENYFIATIGSKQRLMIFLMVKLRLKFCNN